MSDEMKLEVKETMDRGRLNDLLLKMARDVLAGSVEVEGRSVDLPEEMEIELEYKTKEEKSKLELEIKW
jgi:amphi-Trp domain-containing protein